MPDNRCKASQLSFTITSSHVNAAIDRLTSFPSDDVLYTTFAVVNDDTNQHYLQGYIKVSCRVRDTTMIYCLIGPAIFSPCTRVNGTLLEIHLNASFKEFDRADNQAKIFRSQMVPLRTDQSRCIILWSDGEVSPSGYSKSFPCKQTYSGGTSGHTSCTFSTCNHRNNIWYIHEQVEECGQSFRTSIEGV